MTAKKTDHGDPSSEPDFDAEYVERAVVRWLNNKGKGRMSGVGVDPEVLHIHRLLDALATVRNTLVDRPTAPIQEFVWVWQFLRPMLVNVKSVGQHILPANAQLRTFLERVPLDSSTETVRVFLRVREGPGHQGIPDYPLEKERGLGPYQWWHVYRQARHINHDTVKLWADAARKRVRTPAASARPRGRSRGGASKRGSRGRGRGRQSASSSRETDGDNAALPSFRSLRRSRTSAAAAGAPSKSDDEDDSPYVSDHHDQEKGSRYGASGGEEDAEGETDIGGEVGEERAGRRGSAVVAATAGSSRAEEGSDDWLGVFSDAGGAETGYAPETSPGAESPQLSDDDDFYRIAIPRDILESEHPPDFYDGYPINMRHPQLVLADFAPTQKTRAAIVAARNSGRAIPSQHLWALPGMNGLPNKPLHFTRRCEECVEEDLVCWFQGDETCTQCSVRARTCRGGLPPQVEGDLSEHRPRIERRRQLLQKLGPELYSSMVRPNGLQLGWEYLVLMADGSCKVVDALDEEDGGHRAHSSTLSETSYEHDVPHGIHETEMYSPSDANTLHAPRAPRADSPSAADGEEANQHTPGQHRAQWGTRQFSSSSPAARTGSAFSVEPPAWLSTYIVANNTFGSAGNSSGAMDMMRTSPSPSTAAHALRKRRASDSGASSTDDRIGNDSLFKRQRTGPTTVEEGRYQQHTSALVSNNVVRTAGTSEQCSRLHSRAPPALSTFEERLSQWECDAVERMVEDEVDEVDVKGKGKGRAQSKECGPVHSPALSRGPEANAEFEAWNDNEELRHDVNNLGRSILSSRDSTLQWQESMARAHVDMRRSLLNVRQEVADLSRSLVAWGGPQPSALNKGTSLSVPTDGILVHQNEFVDSAHLQSHGHSHAATTSRYQHAATALEATVPQHDKVYPLLAGQPSDLTEAFATVLQSHDATVKSIDEALRKQGTMFQKLIADMKGELSEVGAKATRALSAIEEADRARLERARKRKDRHVAQLAQAAVPAGPRTVKDTPPVTVQAPDAQPVEGSGLTSDAGQPISIESQSLSAQPTPSAPMLPVFTSPPEDASHSLADSSNGNGTPATDSAANEDSGQHTGTQTRAPQYRSNIARLAAELSPLGQPGTVFPWAKHPRSPFHPDIQAAAARRQASASGAKTGVFESPTPVGLSSARVAVPVRTPSPMGPVDDVPELECMPESVYDPVDVDDHQNVVGDDEAMAEILSLPPQQPTSNATRGRGRRRGRGRGNRGRGQGDQGNLGNRGHRGRGMF